MQPYPPEEPKARRRWPLFVGIGVAIVLLAAAVAVGAVIVLRRSNRTSAASPEAPRPLECPELASLTGTATPSTPPKGREPSRSEAAVLESISSEVARIRGADFKEPVRTLIVSREDFTQWSKEQASANGYAQTRSQRIGEMLQFVGSYPADQNLGEDAASAASKSIAGFYREDLKTMIILGDLGPVSSPLTRAVLAHEYTHALQYQNFDLSAVSSRAASGDSEASGGLHAFVEGEATFVESKYAESLPGGRAYGEALLDPSRVEMAGSSPSFIQGHMTFPYVYGGRFVKYLYEHGGWESVNAAYTHPPASTAEIIHPEVYPLAPVTPKVAILALTENVTALTGKSWRVSDGGEVGEFDLGLTLGSYKTGSDPRAAAAGWRGDAYVYAACASDRVFAARFVTANEDEARELETAWRNWGPKWAEAALPTSLAQLTGEIAPAPEKNWAAVRDGSTVTVVLTNSPGLAGPLAEKL